jgi:hypothetical protein
MRADQDLLNRESREKIDKASSLKRECAYARKSLRRYLRGHLFTLQKIKIDRHLKICSVCSSELEALRRLDETRLLLREFSPGEGLASHVRALFSGLARLKVVFYRPLWIAGIVLAAGAVYHYAITPRLIDVELENIVKTAPTSTLHTAGTTTAGVAAEPSPAAALREPDVEAPAPRAVEPLAVTLTANDEKAAAALINDVMRGQNRLRNKRFSRTAREISGELTAGELNAFLNSISDAGKVSYSLRRFNSFSKTLPIPFVLKLREAPRTPPPSPSPSKPVRKAPEAATPAPVPEPAAPPPSPLPQQ